LQKIDRDRMYPSWQHQFLIDAIDQLDLAYDYINQGSINFDRFSLMLIDNVVELTMHNLALSYSASNYAAKAFGGVTYDDEIIKRALGRSFDDKANALMHFGSVSSEECESIKILHNYRNEAHHQGAKHPGIINSLASFYFHISSSLLIKFPYGFDYGIPLDIPYRVQKYVGTAPEGGRINSAFASAFLRLHELSYSTLGKFKDDLVSSMHQLVETADAELNFLCSDDSTFNTRDEVIRKGLSRNIKDPVPSWRRRLEKLEGEVCRHRLLKLYTGFVFSTSDIRDDCFTRAVEFMHMLSDHDE
jgi:hypothetical protein